jgi:Tat protein translocase TatB subunit
LGVDINFGEYFIIFVVALLVFGPERLTEITRKAGSWVRDLRVVANDFRRSLEPEVGDLTQPLAELKDEARGLTDDFKAEVKKLSAETERALDWDGPVHTSGPTHEDSMEDLKRIDNEITQMEASEPEAGGDDD